MEKTEIVAVPMVERVVVGAAVAPTNRSPVVIGRQPVTPPPGQIYCPNCGYIGRAGRVGWDLTGCFISMILFAAFVIPGIIYLLWRDSQAAKIHCPLCHNQQVVRRGCLFVLALFVGFEVIAKVPSLLHTPLMSGANAISGITLVGTLAAAGAQQNVLAMALGSLAVALAMINVVGGFLITHRMLKKFQRRD